MNNWKRITIVTFVLIGGTMFFSYWSITQFDIALDNISALYFEDTHSAYQSFKRNMRVASASPEIAGEVAALTDPGLVSPSPEIADTLTDPGLVSPSPEIPGEIASPSPELALASPSPEVAGELTTLTDPEIAFTFPQKDSKVYIGCTYPITWQPSTMISSLEAAIIDVGSGKVIGPERSGLAKENTVEKELQNLNWKVGSVWPGSYYIEVAKINGIEAEFRSEVFKISRMPTGIDEC